MSAYLPAFLSPDLALLAMANLALASEKVWSISPPLRCLSELVAIMASTPF